MKKTIKPYVNFPEFEKNKKVQEAWRLLKVVLSPMLCRAYTKNRRANEVATILNSLRWDKWGTAVAAGFGLKGKNKALFLGHLRRWADTPLT